jgi:hypothetical protein
MTPSEGEPVAWISPADSGGERPAFSDPGSLPQQREPPCPTCAEAAGEDPAYVYAIGRVEARFPRAAVEKEFAQAVARADTQDKTDHAAFHTVLRNRENRYLTRLLCWVLSVQGLDTYILQPYDPLDFDLLVEAIRPRPSPLDLDVVIGRRGALAAPDLCNGLMAPIVTFDQIYSFDRPTLIGAIPGPADTTAEAFAPTAEELFDRIMQMTDNVGASDADRALNYLAVRYPGIYATTAEQFARNASLSAIEVRPSALGGTRRIVECIFCFRHRATDVVEKFFARVDITEAFPFMVTKMSPYYDRS